ncbi:MAG TPA: D-alanyl-D-alanine carboxypeptidase/D-alanyl-D-alanine-endopeptidase [Gammaproteobacteria bacterium]|nr:D-alanyl-D-alanine carboxypeptidase/D-alanyl-D-alanine-endopeptidase [Gammaproteobacteria bacterium]
MNSRRYPSILMRLFCSSVLLALWLPLSAGADPVEQLPPEVAQALKNFRLSERGLSAYVHEIGQPDPVLAVRADVPRNPASTMKLLTTLVALETLGPAYTWKTEAYALAPVRNGVLDGDLYIKGYGDPYLVIEHFWRFLRALRKAGLEEIRGDLVIDQSFFAPTPGRSVDFDRRPLRAYNVQPRALLVNFQTVNIRFLPEPSARQLRIVADPMPAQLTIDNRVRLASGPCRRGARGLGMQVTQWAQFQKIVFSGRYSPECGDDELYRVVAEDEQYIHGVFETVWTEMGGRFKGGVRDGTVPPEARVLHSAVSPPLAEVIRVVNKYSNNVMARQILLTLGAERYGPPATVDKGITAIREWLAQHGLDFPELVIENGSGLSREARISARHLGQLLLKAYDSPYMPEFLASLPILSTDGTQRLRYGGELAGRAHLKTGSLNAVRAQAGVVHDSKGRRLVVVILHNDARADTGGEAAQTALLSWVNRRP